jgi:IS4 transposase
LPTATLAALYRVRWQAELAIKRLKSLLDIDRLRAREHSALAELYLHGKLL